VRGRPIHWLERIGLVASAATLVAMMALIALEVVLRGAFAVSLQVVDEYSGYLVVALFFLGVPYSLSEGALLRVEFLYKRLRGRRKVAVSLLFDLLCLAFSATVTFELTRYVLTVWRRGVFAPTPAMTPLYLPELVMPLGMAALCVVLTASIARRLKALSRPAGGGRPPGEGAP
jgi:TRAP-type C4-dicarboxylate transport system permease small subunit